MHDRENACATAPDQQHGSSFPVFFLPDFTGIGEGGKKILLKTFLKKILEKGKLEADPVLVLSATRGISMRVTVKKPREGKREGAETDPEGGEKSTIRPA